MSTPARQLKERFWREGHPTEVCTCGHSDLEHGPVRGFDVWGAGPCRLPECSCDRFTWEDFTPEFKRALEEEVK